MNIKPDKWTKRKNALLKFLEIEKFSVHDKIERGGEALASKNATGKGKDLIAASKNGDNQQLRYEQRQRIVCGGLLDRLKMFTNYAANFLEESVDEIEENRRRYLWRVLLSNASTDLLRIQAAAQQRSPGKKNQPHGEVSRNTLIKADIIAEHALEQAVVNGFLDQTPIFTYLKDNITIREVPYANVVMIGVALASMDPDPSAPDPGALDKEGDPLLKVSSDMLAIPHEVGHHLYWKGHMPGGEKSVISYLQEQLKLNRIGEWDWRNNWLEEIFADTYGFLVAGPVMALSFQDLLTDNPPAEIKKDTGRHPIPALRPYIQTRILDCINNADRNLLNNSVPGLLDDRWEVRLENDFSEELAGEKPLDAKYKLQDVTDPLQGRRILEALDEIIKIVLETLRSQKPTGADDNSTYVGWKPWTDDDNVQVEEDLDGLYDKLAFDNSSSFKDHWFQSEIDYIQINEKDIPEKIISGWREKDPEDRGG